ncbi:MAG: photosystem II stability/assembly factor-like uncharacterized protein [Flavobacteriales bacterium]|jgi:photosystem II stability/assembly factor-like uncharacterized protein
MHKDKRILQFFLWTAAIAACALTSIAFASGVDREEKLACSQDPNEEAIKGHGAMRFGQDFNIVEYDFECLGPNLQPKEMNPGGRAIPSYSAERGNGTGRINYVYINPTDNDNVFACSPTGGLFVTYNNGLKWRNAGTDQLPVSGCASVVVNPDDINNWVIATGDSDDRFMYSDGIWRTRDGGETWQNINGKNIEKTFPVAEKSKDWTLVGKVAAHPCNFNRVFVASNKGLFATNNAQEEDPLKVRWTRMAESFFYDVEVYPWNESVVYAAGERFMVSGDCGFTWNDLPLPKYENPEKYPFLRMELEFTNQDPDHIYAAVTCASKHGTASMGPASLHKFNILRKEWTEVRSLRKGMDNMIPTRGRAFDVSPLDSSLIVVGNVQPVYRSTNGGRSFEKIERGQMHDDIHHLNFAADGKTVWAAHDGGVSISFDGGLTFDPRDKGIGAANVFGLAVAQTDEPQVLYGGYDTGGNLLRDGEWFHVTWGDGFQTIIDHSDPHVMFATKQGGHINRTTDRGDNWDDAVYSGSNKAEWHTWIRMNPAYSNIIYCAGKQLTRSMSLGEEWETIFDVREHEDLQVVYKIFTSETNPDVMYIYCLGEKKSNPTLFRTENVNEETVTRIRWEKLDLPSKGWVSDLVIDPDEWKKCWVAYKSIDPEKKVFRYTGDKWIDIGKKLGYARVESMVLDKNSQERLYIGSNYGVFTRSKVEKEWTCLNGMPGLWMKSMAINYQASTLLIGTHGRGIWQCDLMEE